MDWSKVTEEELETGILHGSDVKCPFCQEEGFDLVGLKHHLTVGWCTVFNETEGI